ncbi:MAG: phenylalanine--tRNA ligase subunit beta [Candidatus Moranbacteria bacterium]|nr:phenylalanine--tRNA ligase subunit beta [Candidatus Moranbacteria bacterium]
MKYSYQLIKELSGTKKTPAQLGKLLMTHAFEVEGVEKFSHGIDGVVIGKVVGLRPHPNANKLRVAQVEVGKKDVRTIVCGAPNIALDQKVAVALPSVKLPGGIEIQVATLRGVESNGMVCSAKELGLGDDHEGILVLAEEAPVGASFAKYVGIDDSIIEVKILPDRGSDALAYQGLAREVAALDGYAPHFGQKMLKPVKTPSYNRAAKVVIADKAGCPRYGALAVRGITVGESPLWLKVRLLVSGLRPINNMVDVTNYLMLLTGQPMHAFDADKIQGTVTIRRAKKNEKLVLLTGETKKLSEDDLVIADSERVLALAGVMGGKYSAVTTETKNIFLEVANFSGPSIRRTKNRHHLPTDASYRFERNLDSNLVGEALREAAALLPTLCGGKIMGMRDVYPKEALPTKITLSLDRVEHVLGVKLPLFQVVQHLALLGLKVKKVASENTFLVTVPTRRPDLRDEWDLIEEIGRMHGYEHIVAVAPLLPLIPSMENPEKRFERKTKEYLAAAGFDELLTYSFYGEKEIIATRLPLSAHVELENPLTPDQKYLRLSQVPLLLSRAGENMHHFDSFDCFEWGKVFSKHPKNKEPVEVTSLTLMTVLPKKSEKGDAAPQAGKPFFAIKGKVEAYLRALHIDMTQIAYEPSEKFPELPALAHLHPTRSVCLVHEGKPFGIMGEFHPEVLRSFGVEARLAMAGFVTEDLLALKKQVTTFVPLQKFPYALRDISLVFPCKTTVGVVEQLLHEVGAPLLQEATLFDVYEKGGEKSFAFHLSFGAPDRTLSSAEMDQVFDKIVASAARKEGRLRM